MNIFSIINFIMIYVGLSFFLFYNYPQSNDPIDIQFFWYTTIVLFVTTTSVVYIDPFYAIAIQIYLLGMLFYLRFMLYRKEINVILFNISFTNYKIIQMFGIILSVGLLINIYDYFTIKPTNIYSKIKNGNTDTSQSFKN